MLPILLIHGYSTEGDNKSVAEIYGDLPAQLARELGDQSVVDINLSRWISLDNAVTLDDVSFALDRALSSPKYRKLRQQGFHAVIHSTGALVIRNWLRLYSPKPSPLNNLVHLAGANFGSGLAHIGRGQLARWGRQITGGTGSGVAVLRELEFGSGKTLDMHCELIKPGSDVLADYGVQEFCLIGSQTLPLHRMVPIRYLKEDSSDGTVRCAAGNLNFNYVAAVPTERAYSLAPATLAKQREQRLNDEDLSAEHYQITLDGLARERPTVPFALLYETSHSGDDIGIVYGKDNRKGVLPPLLEALRAPADAEAYRRMAERFGAITQTTLKRAGSRKWSIRDWDPKAQYAPHAMVIFRLRDQFGNDVRHFDVTIRSKRSGGTWRLEEMIEHRHVNEQHPGTITFYLRTGFYDDDKNQWVDKLADCYGVRIEVTGEEPDTAELDYLPLTLDLSCSEVALAVRPLQTTLFDVTLLRLPSRKVFAINP